MKNNIIFFNAEVAETRKETFLGSEHLVVPVVALVEGVITPGNTGIAELMLADEFGKLPGSWNGRPVVVDHPKVNGKNVSASESPTVMENTEIGRLMNTTLEDDKLKTEAWINLDRVEELDDNVKTTIAKLEDGTMVEVSTGLSASSEKTSGEFKGKTFESIIRNVVPDHLAILSHAIGACSIEDGCGAPRMNSRCNCNADPCSCEKKIFVRKPSYEGVEKEEMDFTFTSLAIMYNKDSGSHVSELFEENLDPDFLEWVHTKSLSNNPNPPSEEYLLKHVVVNPENDKLCLNSLTNIIYDEDYSGEETFALKSMAVRLLAEGNKNSSILSKFAKFIGLSHEISDIDTRMALEVALQQSDPWSWVVALFSETFVYQSFEGFFERSYSIVDNVISLSEDIKRVRPETQFVEVQLQEELSMSKETLIAELIANEASPLAEDDKVWLNKLEEDQISKLVPVVAAQTENTSTAEETNSGENETIVVNESPEDFIKKAPSGIQEMLSSGLHLHNATRDAHVKALLANTHNSFSETELKAMPMVTLEKLSKLSHVEDHSIRPFNGAEVPDNAPPPAPKVFEHKE